MIWLVTARIPIAWSDCGL